MEKLSSLLLITGGISQWALVFFILSMFINLAGIKERFLLNFSLLVLVIFTSVHWWGRYELNNVLTKMTCGEMNVPNKLNCQAIKSSELLGFSPSYDIYIITSEKDQPIRLEKFFRENEFQINRKVRFNLIETCNALFFCRYNYSKISKEFEMKKSRIENFLINDLEKQIYFE